MSTLHHWINGWKWDCIWVKKRVYKNEEEAFLWVQVSYCFGKLSENAKGDFFKIKESLLLIGSCFFIEFKDDKI